MNVGIDFVHCANAWTSEQNEANIKWNFKVSLAKFSKNILVFCSNKMNYGITKKYYKM